MLEMFYSMHNLQHEVHMDASPALRFVLLKKHVAEAGFHPVGYFIYKLKNN